MSEGHTQEQEQNERQRKNSRRSRSFQQHEPLLQNDLLPRQHTMNNAAASLESGITHPPDSPPLSRRSPSSSSLESPGIARPRSGAYAETSTPRVNLACFSCRGKRVRCSGTKPVCVACRKSELECEWPEKRARKRTKKEMEEARRVGAGAGDGYEPVEASANYASRDVAQQKTPFIITPDQAPTAPHVPSNYWNEGSATSHYLWPSDLAGLPFSHHLSSASDPAAGHRFDQGFGQGHATPGAGSGRSLPSSRLSVSHSGNENYLPAAEPSLAGSTALGDGTALNGLSGWSPSNDLRLANALKSQTAYITGNPEENEDLELFYYRFVGSTAIRPGINRISLKLQRRNSIATVASPLPSLYDGPHSYPAESSINSTLPSTDLFDSTGMPHEHVWRPLFALFFKHASQHFPNCSYQRTMERISTGTMSQFLACCMCSLGARFQDTAAADPAIAAAPFIAKAQELVTPLLHLPTHDVLSGLLFLAWASYGQNSESGLWQFTGMANRMAIDLGAHEISEIYESPAHLKCVRLLFWSLFVTDRTITFGMGRPPSIPEDIIEIPLPVDDDFFPDFARDFPSSPYEPVEPVPYVQLVKLMVIVGRISNVLNGRRGRSLTLVQTPEPLQEQLAELQLRLVTFHANLAPSLNWSAENFKHQHARGHSGTFLSIHLWVNAVLALIYHPELLKSPSGTETPLNKSMERNLQLSLASSRQIVECMVFADLVDSSSYTSSGGFLSQPVFVAAMAFIHEMRSLQSTMDPTVSAPLFPLASEPNTLHPNSIPNSRNQSNLTNILMLSIAKQNFTTLLNAIYKMEEYWAAIGHVSALLEKRSGFQRPSSKASKKTFISLPDKGLLKRFTTDPQHPQSVGPPTDTSLRDSIARSEQASSAQLSALTPMWLSDLMPGYTVENMSFGPVDSFDLERLLASDEADLGYNQI